MSLEYVAHLECHIRHQRESKGFTWSHCTSLIPYSIFHIPYLLSFICYPLSWILYCLSILPYFLYFILYTIPLISNLVHYIRYPISLPYPLSFIHYLLSHTPIPYQLSTIHYPVPITLYLLSHIPYPLSMRSHRFFRKSDQAKCDFVCLSVSYQVGLWAAYAAKNNSYPLYEWWNFSQCLSVQGRLAFT